MVFKESSRNELNNAASSLTREKPHSTIMADDSKNITAATNTVESMAHACPAFNVSRQTHNSPPPPPPHTHTHTQWGAQYCQV